MKKNDKSKCLNIRHISKELTGSPNKIRADFTPKKWVTTMRDCGEAITSIIERDKPLNKKQGSQKERMGI